MNNFFKTTSKGLGLIALSLISLVASTQAIANSNKTEAQPRQADNFRENTRKLTVYGILNEQKQATSFETEFYAGESIIPSLRGDVEKLEIFLVGDPRLKIAPFKLNVDEAFPIKTTRKYTVTVRIKPEFLKEKAKISYSLRLTINK